MTTRIPNRWLIASVVGCVAVLVGAVLLIRIARGSFTITGTPPGPMRQGVMTPLDIAFTNSNDFAISVTNLRVTVGGVSAPNADGRHLCTIGDFEVFQVPDRVRITIHARATSSLSSLRLPRASWPRVGLVGEKGHAGCMGASVTLRYHAIRRLNLL
jgi:hypothetical protein